jgi:hypothetical protein
MGLSLAQTQAVSEVARHLYGDGPDGRIDASEIEWTTRRRILGE